jgi:ferritin-like metal-binding protein YciE
MANDQDLFDLFHGKLREMWFAEKKIHASLPKMAKAAQSDALRAAFKKHEAETKRQMSLPHGAGHLCSPDIRA